MSGTRLSNEFEKPGLEADFIDEINQTVDFIFLAPTTPAEADFSDTI